MTLIRRYQGAINTSEGAIEALSRLYQDAIKVVFKALLRRHQGSIDALLTGYYTYIRMYVFTCVCVCVCVCVC